MISIFFQFFFVILNWHHKHFTHKFLKKEKDQNCSSKSPRVSRRGTVFALLQMPSKCSLALSLKGGFSAPDKANKKTKRWSRSLLAICYATKGRSKHPLFLFPPWGLHSSSHSAILKQIQSLQWYLIMFWAVRNQRRQETCSKLVNVFICYFDWFL